jgi:hypothetical protein
MTNVSAHRSSDFNQGDFIFILARIEFRGSCAPRRERAPGP